MGIYGLTSYVKKRSETFSKKMELSNTRLVVDGFCLACRLYHSNNCNCCFGGDYGEYAFYVSQFLDELLKCNITPLIVFDGGFEDKKMSTILTRCKERIKRASYCRPDNDQQLMPLLAINVFKYIVQQKKIKIVQASFEADEQIASIARILKCPVLSNDSDFFIFDVMYIPIDSLENGIFENPHGYYKKCRLHTNDSFINNFPGMDRKNLPLAAALLGNDYIDSKDVENFFTFIGISNNEKGVHYKIETLLWWLQNQSVDKAVAIVLDKLDPEERESALEKIEMVMNGYLVPSLEMLKPLGYTLNEMEKLTEAIEYELYKFNKTKTLKLSEKLKSRDFEEACNNSQVNQSIPTWFLKEFNAANFPGFFMSMIQQQLMIPSEQMENYRYPPSIFVSLKIIRVIFKLLSNGTSNSKMLEYIARGKGIEVTSYNLDCGDNLLKNQGFPTLENLVQLSKLERKQILVSTLGVSDQLIMEFPPAWRLYIAVIKYWLNRADKIFATECHLYSLILLIIYHVAKKVNQSGSYFERSATSNTKNQVDKEESQGKFSVDMPVKEALEKVKAIDCIKALEFFKPCIKQDKTDFDIDIVHAFSLLQNVMKYSIFLNVLLGYPYPNLNVAEFFSGTMVYNFYRDLNKYNQLKKRISNIFASSPSILQLFISVSTKIQDLIDSKSSDKKYFKFQSKLK